MAFETLDPISAIWRKLGVAWVLVPEGFTPQAPQASQQRSALARPAYQPGPTPQGQYDNQANQAQTQRPACQYARPQNQHPGHAAPRQVPQPVKPAQSASPELLPESEWPEIWREQFAKARKGKIAWTYAKLGSDLTSKGKEDADGRSARSKLLRRLIADLALPGGSNSFWPLSLGGEERFDIFWSGVNLLGSRYILVFGAAAFSALTGVKSPALFGQWRNAGRMAWHLPDIDSINDSNYGRVVGFLRNILPDARQS